MSEVRLKDINDVFVIINAKFNNTLVNVINLNGDVVFTSSAGACGFKGAKKATPYAAQVVAKRVMQEAFAKYKNIKNVSIIVKGPGPGRSLAIKAINSVVQDFDGARVASIEDRTPIPHNGCRGEGEKSG